MKILKNTLEIGVEKPIKILHVLILHKKPGKSGFNLYYFINLFRLSWSDSLYRTV